MNDATQIRNYRTSIKCKYCKFYNEKKQLCYLCTGYDRLLDKDNTPDKAFMPTQPDSYCSSFALSALEVIALNSLRDDGSYITQMPDDMKAALSGDPEAERNGCLDKITLVIALLVFTLVFLILLPLFV